MTLENKFGSEVFKARTSLGFTQERLAELINKSTRTIQYIEKGELLPSKKTMLQIMIVLRMSADLFWEEVGVNVPVYSREREIVFIGGR